MASRRIHSYPHQHGQTGSQVRHPGISLIRGAKPIPKVLPYSTALESGVSVAEAARVNVPITSATGQDRTGRRADGGLGTRITRASEARDFSFLWFPHYVFTS